MARGLDPACGVASSCPLGYQQATRSCGAWLEGRDLLQNLRPLGPSGLGCCQQEDKQGLYGRGPAFPEAT